MKGKVGLFLQRPAVAQGDRRRKRLLDSL